MCSRGTPVGTTIVVDTGRGILLTHGKTLMKEFGGSLVLNKEWAKSVLRRMGFTKRGANSKSKIIPENFLEMKKQFSFDIKAVVKMEDISNELIVNWDQTAMKVVPSES